MNKHILTIIIPAYNVETWIGQLLNNLYTNISEEDENRFTVMIVDDGPIDSTKKEIEKYSQHKSLQYMYKKNTGIASTRNFALSFVDSEYFWMIDSDDLIEPNFIPYILNLLEKSKYDVVRMGYSNDLKINNESSYNLTNEDHLLEKYLSGQIKSYIWQFIFRSDLFIKNIKFTDGIVYEDLGMFYEIIKLFNKTQGIYIKNNIYKYRIRKNSIVHTLDENVKYSIKYLMDKYTGGNSSYPSEMQFIVSSVAAQIMYDIGDYVLYKEYSRHIKITFFNSWKRIKNKFYWGKYIVVKSPQIRSIILKIKQIIGRI